MSLTTASVKKVNISAVRVQKDQVLRHLIADMEVDDPVHEVKGDEGNRKEDAGVLVDV